MTNVLCIRCGEPIVFGQLFRMIQDESGRVTYSHVVRMGYEFVPGCPQPEPVAESGEEEEPAIEGPASPQVNTSAELPGATERTAGETLSTDRAARSVVGAPPSFDLESLRRELAQYDADRAVIVAATGRDEPDADWTCVIRLDRFRAIVAALERAERLQSATRRAEFQLTQQGVDGPGDDRMVFFVRTLRKIRDQLRAALAEDHQA